jgi:ketosteroid isomerase-like protein
MEGAAMRKEKPRITWIGSFVAASFLCAGASVAVAGVANASEDHDRRAVAALDTAYQLAVKANDAPAMARILDEEFTLVTGDGKMYSRADLLAEARSGKTLYEQQDEAAGTQTVRIWGNTAVVTALLWIKGVSDNKPFDYKLWFSDTYVRTRAGWRYVFGQASRPLAAAPSLPSGNDQ